MGQNDLTALKGAWPMIIPVKLIKIHQVKMLTHIVQSNTKDKHHSQ